MSQSRTAACACGSVAFELTGPPLAVVHCCCDDCVAGAAYVERKAAAAQHAGTSNRVDSQVIGVGFWPRGGIKYVRGREKLVYFRMLDAHKTLKAYTSCCSTLLLVRCGREFVIRSAGTQFNLRCISEQPAVQYRIFEKDALRPSELPPLPATAVGYAGLALSFGLKIVYYSLFGARNIDALTLEVLDAPTASATEVAGPTAYKAVFPASTK